MQIMPLELWISPSPEAAPVSYYLLYLTEVLYEISDLHIAQIKDYQYSVSPLDILAACMYKN